MAPAMVRRAAKLIRGLTKLVASGANLGTPACGPETSHPKLQSILALQIADAQIVDVAISARRSRFEIYHNYRLYAFAAYGE